MRTEALPSVGKRLQHLMLQAEVRLKAELQRDPLTIPCSAYRRAAEFGREQVGLPASSVWRAHRALNFLFSWDNQPFVFSPTTLATRDKKALKQRGLNVVLAT